MSIKNPDQIDIAVGQRIRIARVAKAISQETLADALGLTFQQVQKYEKGTNRIAPSRLVVVAATLDRPVAWFYGEPGNAAAVAASSCDLLATTREGQRLADAFLEIGDKTVRTHIVGLAEKFAAIEAAVR